VSSRYTFPNGLGSAFSAGFIIAYLLDSENGITGGNFFCCLIASKFLLAEDETRHTSQKLISSSALL